MLQEHDPEKGLLDSTSSHLVTDSDKARHDDSSDWKSRLDEFHNTEILEYAYKNPSWRSVPVSEIDEPLTLPKNTQFRLFLVEGLTLDVIKYFSWIDEDFFRCHWSSNAASRHQRHQNSSFFTKGFRRVCETKEQLAICKKIAEERPWSLDTIVDPVQLGLEHNRYKRLAEIPRSCALLEANQNLVRPSRAALPDCISCSFYECDGGTIGVIVFDAPSRIRIKHFKGINKTNLNKLEETTSTFSPHFHEYTPSKRLFTERLEEATRQGALAPQGLDHLVRNVTIQLNVNNQREVNADFRESLDYVNVLVKLPKITITQVLGWLKVCEGWRDVKSAVGPSIACYRSLIQDDHLSAHVRPTEADIETAKSRVDPLSRESLLHELEDIGTELKSISDRATLAISIMKNREKEARLSNASRFATWAFTIIPFMILVSVLGACLIDWRIGAQYWTWIFYCFALVVLACFTRYSIRNFPEIALTFRAKPSYVPRVTRLILKHYGQAFPKWCSSASMQPKSIWFLTLWVILLAGDALGIWIIATSYDWTLWMKLLTTGLFGLYYPSVMKLVMLLTFKPHGRKLALFSFVGLLSCCALAIWTVLDHWTIPHHLKVLLAIGIMAEFPMACSSWLPVFSKNGGLKTWLYFSASWTSLPLIMWAVLFKSSLDPAHAGGLSSVLCYFIPFAMGFWRDKRESRRSA